MSPELDPERGRAVAAKLRELGGAAHFDPVTTDQQKNDWAPTHEHFPVPKREGGHRAVDNAILAHRLCNRLDYSLAVGRSHRRDLERIEKARAEAIRRTQSAARRGA